MTSILLLVMSLSLAQPPDVAPDVPPPNPPEAPPEASRGASQPAPHDRSSHTLRDPSSVWVKANSAYQEGNYRAALEGYEALAAAGFDSGALQYNLGNTYLRTGNLGLAVAAYLRSQRELPRDADVEANLSFARRSTKDAIPRSEKGLLETFFFWHTRLSITELGWASVLSAALFWLLLAARSFREESEALRWAVGVALVVALALGISFGIRTVSPTHVAVVKAPELEVHSGMSRDAVVQFVLHAGSEMRLMERRGDWLRVALGDGKQGWVHEDDVVIVAL